jgi:hypothetical protein
MMETESEDGDGFHHNMDKITDNWFYERTKMLVIEQSAATDEIDLDMHQWFRWATSVVRDDDNYMYFPTLLSMNLYLLAGRRECYGCDGRD